MQDQYISYDEIECELREIEDMGDDLHNKLLEFENTVAYIFLKIKESIDRDGAQDYFNYLEIVQVVLAKLVYKYDMKISERLYCFMNDFDNFEVAKKYYFEKIQNGEYTF